MNSAHDEEQRIVAAKQGDKVAMGELLLDAYNDLAGFLRPRIPPLMQRHLSVEDLIQQVFTKAYTDVSMIEFRGPGSFQAWLRTIGEFRLRDAIKQMQRKKRGGDRLRIEGTNDAMNSAADVMAMLIGNDPTASRVLRHREAEQAMRLAIAELPEDYRDVIRLRYFEMLSVQETAAAMQRTEAAVRALTDRAKKSLREALGRISMYLSSRR